MACRLPVPKRDRKRRPLNTNWPSDCARPSPSCRIVKRRCSVCVTSMICHTRKLPRRCTSAPALWRRPCTRPVSSWKHSCWRRSRRIMMDDKIPTPNNTPPIQELSDTLRPAVNQVRAAVPPADAVERSMDRAQRLGPPPRRRSRRWLAYSAAAGIAVAILGGFWLWPNLEKKSPNAVAEDRNEVARRLSVEGGWRAAGSAPLSKAQRRSIEDETSNTIMSQGQVPSRESESANLSVGTGEAKNQSDDRFDAQASAQAMGDKGSSTIHTRRGRPEGPRGHAQADLGAMNRPLHEGGSGGGAAAGYAKGMTSMGGRSMGMNGGMAGMGRAPGVAGPPASTWRATTESDRAALK